MVYCEGNLCLSSPSFLKRDVLDYFRKTLILRLNQRFPRTGISVTSLSRLLIPNP